MINEIKQFLYPTVKSLDYYAKCAARTLRSNGYTVGGVACLNGCYKVVIDSAFSFDDRTVEMLVNISSSDCRKLYPDVFISQDIDVVQITCVLEQLSNKMVF